MFWVRLLTIPIAEITIVAELQATRRVSIPKHMLNDGLSVSAYAYRVAAAMLHNEWMIEIGLFSVGNELSHWIEQAAKPYA